MVRQSVEINSWHCLPAARAHAGYYIFFFKSFPTIVFGGPKIEWRQEGKMALKKGRDEGKEARTLGQHK